MTDNKWGLETTLTFMLQNYEKGMNFRITYFSNKNIAPLEQKLQLIDNSNPLYITLGNPDLKDMRLHTIATYYANKSPW